MEEKDLEVIANASPGTFMPRYEGPNPNSQSKLVEHDFRDLVQGFNPLAVVIGRARNPQQLGNLDVIQMDFKPVGGDETTLLVLHVPTRPGVSVSDIVRKEFAGVELLTVQKPVLEVKVLVVAAPYYVKPATARPRGVKPLGEYAEIARCHLNLGNSERALRIAEAAINSCEADLEAYLVKAQAASNLRLHYVATKAYEAALSLVTVGSAEHTDISERFGKAKMRLEQALNGNFVELIEGEIVDYASELIEIQPVCRTEPEVDGAVPVVDATGVFAREPIAAGEVVVVSNGIEEGSNAFAMVLDACGKSSRLRKQVELLWFYGLRRYPLVGGIPNIVSSFRPPEALDSDDDVLLNVANIWCSTRRASLKGNGSSLWPLPCFFYEVADDRHNVDVQVKGRTMFLRAKRDIKRGEELKVQGKEDVVVQTRFWYQSRVLVKEEVHNGDERVDYLAWGLCEDPPADTADTDWDSFIEGPVRYHCVIPYTKEELDRRSPDEIVTWLVAECNEP